MYWYEDGEHYEDLRHKITWIVSCTLSFFCFTFSTIQKIICVDVQKVKYDNGIGSNSNERHKLLWFIKLFCLWFSKFIISLALKSYNYWVKTIENFLHVYYNREDEVGIDASCKEVQSILKMFPKKCCLYIFHLKISRDKVYYKSHLNFIILFSTF